MINYNITIENEYPNWHIEQDKILKIILQIFEYYMCDSEIVQNCCLQDYEYETLAFDILFTAGKTTHQINRQYRQKDYPADIITFAIFADLPQDERLINNLEINLGEVIIGLDKVVEEANRKGISKEAELIFLISHGIMHLLGFDHQTDEEFEFIIKTKKSIGKYWN